MPILQHVEKNQRNDDDKQRDVSYGRENGTDAARQAVQEGADAALDISAQLRQLGRDIQSLNPFLFNHLLIEFIQGTDHARQIRQQFSELAYEIRNEPQKRENDDADQQNHDDEDAYRPFDVQPVLEHFDERSENIIQKPRHKHWREDRRDEGADRIKNKVDFGGHPYQARHHQKPNTPVKQIRFP